MARRHGRNAAPLENLSELLGWDLVERHDMTVNVEAHRRLRVAGSFRELAQARARVRALEATDDDREQERLKAYLAALDEERRGVEQKLSHALSLGNDRERVLDPTSPSGYRLAEYTGAERALVLDSQLGAIDREAARVRKLVG